MCITISTYITADNKYTFQYKYIAYNNNCI